MVQKPDIVESLGPKASKNESLKPEGQYSSGAGTQRGVP